MSSSVTSTTPTPTVQSSVPVAPPSPPHASMQTPCLPPSLLLLRCISPPPSPQSCPPSQLPPPPQSHLQRLSGRCTQAQWRLHQLRAAAQEHVSGWQGPTQEQGAAAGQRARVPAVRRAANTACCTVRPTGGACCFCLALGGGGGEEEGGGGGAWVGGWWE